MTARYSGAAVLLTTALVCSALTTPAFADGIDTVKTTAADISARISITAQPMDAVGPIDTSKEPNLSAALPLASTGTEQPPNKLEVIEREYYTRQTLEAQEEALSRHLELQNKQLAYDPELIAVIGNQLNGGHTVCCPGYACAYGDAIITGVANDHSLYGCGSCTWPDWGGGNSSFRSLGSNEALLREAYDQIAADRPTVIHVSGPYGEHWITLMGYHDVVDPDNLTLSNFTALDPADGTEIDPSGKYVLYGDFCEHISTR